MQETADWIGTWNDILDTAVSAVLFYVLIVALVRLSGTRTTSQLNNFDWIINVMVGSLAASGILLDTVPVLRAMVAIIVLLALQFILTSLVQRYEWVARIVKASPTLLAHKGEFLEGPMRKTRISEEEICAVLREHGLTSADAANWVVLETDGKLTVIPSTDIALHDADTMGNVVAPDALRATEGAGRGG